MMGREFFEWGDLRRKMSPSEKAVDEA